MLRVCLWATPVGNMKSWQGAGNLCKQVRKVRQKLGKSRMFTQTNQERIPAKSLGFVLGMPKAWQTLGVYAN